MSDQLKEEFSILLSKSLEDNSNSVHAQTTHQHTNKEHDNSKENLQRVFDTLSRTLPKLFVQVSEIIKIMNNN